MLHLRVAVVLALAGVALAQDDLTVLERMASDDPATSDAALTEWEALPRERQTALAHTAMQVPESAAARSVLDLFSPWALSPSGLRARMQTLLAQPDWHGDDAAIASRDVEAIWLHPGTTPSALEDLHRETARSNLPGLLDLVDRVNGERRPALIDTIRGLAWYTDDEHERVAQVCVDALREETEESTPLPPLRRHGSGLPPHFERIARAAWGIDRRHVGQRVFSRIVSWAWLLRWAGAVTPTLADLEFLDELLLDTEIDEARAWALRHRVRLSGDGAIAWLLTANEEIDGELDIAAHLAIAGRIDEWEAMTRADPDLVLDTPLAWEIDRTRARNGWAQAGGELSVQQRARMRIVWGVEIGAPDMDAIGERLAEMPARLADECTFYARFHSEGLRGARLHSLARRLAAVRAREPALGNLDDEDLRIVLGLFAAREPDALDLVLRAWEGADAALAGRALTVRIRQGASVDANVAWELWERTDGNWGWFWDWDEPSLIGLVNDDVIRKRLVDVVPRNDERATNALQALARRAGLDSVGCAGLTPPDDDWDNADWRPVRAAILRSDVDATLDAASIAAGREWFVKSMSVERMRAARDEHEDDYWPASLGLAIRGDRVAADEVRSVLTENRTELLDPISFDEHPRGGRIFADLHADRLGHNCCAHFQAWVALSASFPTMPISKDAFPVLPDREIAREWLDRHGSGLVWSPIADGWLPR